MQVIRYLALGADEILCENLVEQDEVVSGTRGALKRVVGLQEEIPVAGFSDSGIDNAKGPLQSAMFFQSRGVEVRTSKKRNFIFSLRPTT